MKNRLYILLFFVSSLTYAKEYDKLALGLNINSSSSFIGGIDLKLNQWKGDNFFLFELVNVKHSNEIRFASGFGGGNSLGNKSFIIGKNNYLFALRAQFGKGIKMFNAAERNGIKVHANFSSGLVFGFVKPYIIKYAYSDDNVSTEQYDNTIHTSFENIKGRGGVLSHFEETKIVPGLNGRFALSFEYGKNNKFFSMLETGAFVELYAKKIELIDGAYSQQFFSSVFVSLFIGKNK